MKSYFAKLEKQNWRLLVADDDSDLLTTLSQLNFTYIEESQLIKDYKATQPSVVVLLLDSWIRYNDHIKGKTWIDWLKEADIQNHLELNRALVLYSGEQINSTAFHRCFMKSDNLLKDLKQIILLLEEGIQLDKWPLSAQPVNDISRTIHTLHNLLLPVRLDAETLAELSEKLNPEVTAEVFSDHFTPSTSSYLSSQSHLHEGGEILGRVEELCKALSKNVQVSIKTERESFSMAVTAAREAFREHTSGQSFSRAFPTSNELMLHLKKIASSCDALIHALREIRNQNHGESY
jgi:hypothetical protein